MNIAYLLSHDITRNDGVTLKILTQVSEWNNQGHNVKVFCQVPSKGDSILKSNQYEVGNSYIKSRLYPNKILLNDISDFNPDVIYFRYDTYSQTIQKLLYKYSIVTEINTNDLSEFYILFKKERTIKSFIRYLIYILFRNAIFNNVKGIIAVTKELSLNKSISKYNKPSIAVSNSINIDDFPTIKVPNENKKGIFFIGTPNQPWHGVDFIDELASNLTQYDFHIVGIEGESRHNLYYHGYLGRKEYQIIMKECCICIGSLAMYRNDMYESNSLKVREYIAGGFPVILGCKDSAYIDEEQPHWMKVVDTRHGLDIENIERFIDNYKKFIIPDEQKLLISSRYNESKRLQFIENVIHHD
ncbi:hypothetical protein AAFX60_000790 [Aliivibrio fischeri]